ncbi:hypothetical protein GC169_07645 [bacterium]|nr:hypothetical protein [bacterium]
MKLLVVAAIAAGLLSASPAFAQSKIAVVDANRLVTESVPGVTARTAMEKDFAVMTANLQKETAALSEAEQGIITREAAASQALAAKPNPTAAEQAARDKAATQLATDKAALETRRARVANLTRDYQRTQSERVLRERTKLLASAQTAAETVRAQKGYDIVLEKSTVFTFTPAIDITADVMAVMNKK